MTRLIENGRVVFGAADAGDFWNLLLKLKPDTQLWPLQLYHDGQLLFEAADYADFCAKMNEIDPEPVILKVAA